MFSNICIIIYNSFVIDVMFKVIFGVGSVMVGVRLSVMCVIGGGFMNILILILVNMFVIFVIVVMVMGFVGEKNFIKKDYFLIYIFFYLKSIDILDSF